MPPSPQDSGNEAYFGFKSSTALVVGILVIVGALIVSVVSTASLRNQLDATSFDVGSLSLTVGIGVGIALGALLLLYIIAMLMLTRIRHHYRRERSLNSVLISVKVPKFTEILADASEAIFNSLYSVYEASTLTKRINKYFAGQESFSFEIVSQKQSIDFYMYVHKDLAELLSRQIYSQYPDADVAIVEDYSVFFPDCRIKFTELRQTAEPAHPIKSYRDLAKEAGTQQLKDITVDSMSALTNAIGKLEEDEAAVVQFVIRPTGKQWQQEGEQLIKKIYDKTKGKDNQPGEQLTSGDQEKIRALESAISKPGFETVLRIVTVSDTENKADMNLKNILAAFEHFAIVGHNRLHRKKRISKTFFFRSFLFRYMPLINYKPAKWLFGLNPFIGRVFGQTMTFNTEELASLYHFPNKNINTPQINWLKAKRAPAPQEVPTTLMKKGQVAEAKGDVIMQDRNVMGFNMYRGVKKDVCIKREDRRRHVYSIGRTGMGKSVFMENQIYQDIVNGEGVCVIDPHGDLARKCLEFVPKSRINDVIYFDPSDVERPMGLNMLEAHTPEEKDFAVAEMVAILYKLFAEFIGPRFEHIVRNSMLAIMEHPDGGTLVEMMRILTDDAYKDECLKYVTNPLVKAFWQEEMAQQVQFHKSEMLGPVLSKFGRFVSNDMMRNIIGQTKSAFNFREIMDKQKILLINLAKGKVGDINCNLLGMIVVSKLLIASLSRTDIAEEDRKDFYLYVDEFQNFATDSFATILSEARKYRLSLNVTHQYVGQLKEEIQKAVFGNVGTFISFRIGAPDAELVAKEFKPIFDETDMVNVEKYTCYIKLLVDGVTTKGFSMHTFPPVKIKHQNYADKIHEICRLKYGLPRSLVDKEIRRRGQLDKVLQAAGQ